MDLNLRYHPGGSHHNVIILWKVPSERDSGEMLTTAAHLLATVEEKLPVYHIRQMRKDIANRFDLLNVVIPKHFIRNVYAELTLDASADQNPSVDERVRLAVLHCDPDLIVDLRHLNKGRQVIQG